MKNISQPKFKFGDRVSTGSSIGIIGSIYLGHDGDYKYSARYGGAHFSERRLSIYKYPCKHEPNILYVATAKGVAELGSYTEPRHINCKHCGVELTATWSEKV